MSLAKESRQNTASQMSATWPPGVTPWVRPEGWLPLPDITGIQRFVGLFAVFPAAGNFVALSAAAAYTVDWGDGTAPVNYASGVTALKQFDYASVPAGGEATFGYRQAIIQIYPQAGNNLVTVNLNLKHTLTNLRANHSNWLEVAVNGAYLSSFSPSGATCKSEMLQSVIVMQAVLTNFSCSQALNLRNVSVSHEATGGWTYTNNCFDNCKSLQYIPYLNTRLVTTFYQMFLNCSSLVAGPVMDTGNATDFSSLFQGCTALRYVPRYNTSKGITFYGMHNSCSSLLEVPHYDTALGTQFTNFLSNCMALQKVPLFDIGKASDVANFLLNCYSLREIPNFNLEKATNLPRFAEACYALNTVPLLNIAATAVGTFVASRFFYNCNALRTVPAIDFTKANTLANAFDGTTNLTRCSAIGINVSVVFGGCSLSGAELDAIYTNLSATGAGKTISVPLNYGIATHTPTIATAKGWTVTTV